MRESTGGCPVQHAQSNNPSAEGNEQPSSGNSGPGVWSGVAAWLPFRGGGEAKRSGGSVTVDLTSSAGSGSGAAIAPVQGMGLGTKEHGGCPVSSSEGDGDPPASSGCPVQHDSAATSGSKGLGSVWGFLTGGGDDGGGGKDDAPGASASSAVAPAALAPQRYNALNNEYVYGNEVAPEQEMPLSTSRQRSSIPKAEFNPGHQPQKEADRWVYPSEQQYYNAIKRKGYKASATDMPSTLAIHNAVNEKGWEMVQEWERARAEAASGWGEGGADVSAPKLLRFTGRPQDTSPKAWVKSTLLGYRPPFDRDDAATVVQTCPCREDGNGQIFAMGTPHRELFPNKPRSVDAAVDRTRMFYRKEVRPYLSGVLDAFKREPGPPPSDQDAPPPAR
eukprot:g2430.t1